MVALTLAAILLGVPAQDAEWKAGVATVKVTPKEPIWLSGYASRNKPFERIEQDLYAKALVLEDSKGSRGAIVTSDLIGFSAAIAEGICGMITEKTGMERSRILLNSSHTHTGPSLRIEVRLSRDQTEADAKKTIAYTRWMMEQVADLVARAVEDLKPARLSWGHGVSNIPMNRREFTRRGVRLGVNPRGLVDRQVPILRIDDPSGKLRGILFKVACHGTTLGGRDYMVCGDYMGFAQAHLQEALGVPALFMAGVGGDANPYPRGKLEYAQANGKKLADEVQRVLKTKLVPVRGPLRIAFDHLDVPFEKAPPRDELERLAEKGPGSQRGVFRAQLELLKKGEKPATHYRAPFTVWQFGDDLTLVGLPGEVVVDFVSFTERDLGPLKLWVAAYCNDVFGYIPSARVLEEGGYECRGTYYGAKGIFSAEAERVVMKKIVELAKEAGRKFPGPRDVRRR